jgi:hypothetical protein
VGRAGARASALALRMGILVIYAPASRVAAQSRVPRGRTSARTTPVNALEVGRSGTAWRDDADTSSSECAGVGVGRRAAMGARFAGIAREAPAANSSARGSTPGEPGKRSGKLRRLLSALLALPPRCACSRSLRHRWQGKRRVAQRAACSRGAARQVLRCRACALLQQCRIPTKPGSVPRVYFPRLNPIASRGCPPMGQYFGHASCHCQRRGGAPCYFSAIGGSHATDPDPYPRHHGTT